MAPLSPERKTIVSASAFAFASEIASRSEQSTLLGLVQSDTTDPGSAVVPTVKVVGAACATPDTARVAPAVRPPAATRRRFCEFRLASCFVLRRLRWRELIRSFP
jgi:hypothetical protein